MSFQPEKLVSMLRRSQKIVNKKNQKSTLNGRIQTEDKVVEAHLQTPILEEVVDTLLKKWSLMVISRNLNKKKEKKEVERKEQEIQQLEHENKYLASKKKNKSAMILSN